MSIYNALDPLKVTLRLNEEKDTKIMKEVDKTYNPYIYSFVDVKIDEAIKRIDVSKVVKALKPYLDNEICETIFGAKFNAREIKKVLTDRVFVYFLIKSHLLNRTCKIEVEGSSAFKIRLYYSILTFMKYQKNK